MTAMIEELETLRTDLSDAKCELESIQQEEEGYLEAMPESFRQGSKCEQAEEAIGNLGEAISSAEDVDSEIGSAIEALRSVPIETHADADETLSTEVAISQDPEADGRKANFLEKWDAMRLAIDQAHTLFDLKSIRDQAEALRYAALVAGQSKDVVRKACEIKIRAERRAGELLKVMPKQTPGQYQQLQSANVATYAELGINKVQAHRWQQIASIQPQDFEDWVSNTAEISTAGALQRAKVQKRVHDASARVPTMHREQGGKYSILLADPPWEYSDAMNKIDHWGGALNHYQTIGTEELCGFKVPVDDEEEKKSICEIMEQDSVLFLWATAPMMPHALRLIEAWGFKFKTFAFVWIKKDADGKPTIGMGSYTRANAEVCLLGVRGNGIPRMDASVSSVIETTRLAHSEKPAEVRDRIVRLFGDLPRLELFSRQKVEGWDCFGDELPTDS